MGNKKVTNQTTTQTKPRKFPTNLKKNKQTNHNKKPKSTTTPQQNKKTTTNTPALCIYLCQKINTSGCSQKKTLQCPTRSWYLEPVYFWLIMPLKVSQNPLKARDGDKSLELLSKYSGWQFSAIQSK